MGDYRHIVVKQNGETVRITMNRPERRNALGPEGVAPFIYFRF